MGAVYRVDFVGVEYGSLAVTAWRRKLPRWLSWREAARSVHVGCPACREWFHPPASALGNERACPNCGTRLRLNALTINADWRRVAKAWGGS
jgi:hypothetical protein